MSLKRYLILITLATLLCWFSFLAVIFFINPQAAGFWGFVLFYLSLFLAGLGTFCLIGFFIRVWLSDQPIFRQVIISFRQAIWFSSLIVFSLILQSQKILSWWIIFLFIIILALIESIFLFSQRKK